MAIKRPDLVDFQGPDFIYSAPSDYPDLVADAKQSAAQAWRRSGRPQSEWPEWAFRKKAEQSPEERLAQIEAAILQLVDAIWSRGDCRDVGMWLRPYTEKLEAVAAMMRDETPRSAHRSATGGDDGKI